MPPGWTTTRLGDIAKIEHGWPFQGEHLSEDLTGRPIVVSIGNFRYTGGFRFESTTLREYRAEYPKEFELRAGDILLVMTCQTSGGEILGIPARIPDDGKAYLHNQRMGKVAIRRPERVRSDFLYWLFLWKEFNRELVASASGTKIVHTAPNRIEAFAFDLPPLEEQEAIAGVLSALDDKIELNRQMNRTLEELAQALFKSWFVDFDPVVAKAAGRQPFGMDAETAELFPDHFQDSELGEIPTGWSVSPIREVVSDVFDGPHATPPESNHGAVYLGIRNFTGTQLDLADIRHISEADWATWTRRVTPRPGDIVFTYEATLGFFALIPPGLRCCLGRRTALVRARDSANNQHYIFHYFVAPPFQEFLRSRVRSGSTVDRILLKDFPDYPILVPPPELVEQFERFGSSIWVMIHSNLGECHTLNTLRDMLLPKLLSGEIRVREAEQIAEEASA